LTSCVQLPSSIRALVRLISTCSRVVAVQQFALLASCCSNDIMCLGSYSCDLPYQQINVAILFFVFHSSILCTSTFAVLPFTYSLSDVQHTHQMTHSPFWCEQRTHFDPMNFPLWLKPLHYHQMAYAQTSSLISVSCCAWNHFLMSTDPIQHFTNFHY